LTPRIHVERPLAPGDAFELPAEQARHVQVLRLQPGDALVLFNGGGGEWQARVAAMGRTGVRVELLAAVDVDRELARPVTIALGMPANERMDLLVEKATELGVAAIQPLVCERSVLRLAGERAARRVARWQAIAVAASEQCGRTRVPVLAPVLALERWLTGLPAGSGDTRRFMLDPEATLPWRSDLAGPAGTPLVVLSGPEGGFSAAESEAGRRAGFTGVTLGPRILRADTAPLALLATVSA
jgi:16S rRNA (uracil1498-N3)-methyltransferase